jgi:hypothetical protein
MNIRSKYNAETLVRKLKRLPSKALAKWIAENPGIVLDIDYEDGFITESGFAYDVLLCPGKTRGDDYAFHTIIEPRAADVLAILKGVENCHCASCQEELRGGM